MTIVKLYGGLGNQLFQYSTAYAFTKRRKDILFIDISWFKQNFKGLTKREFLLDKFYVDYKIANKIQIKETKKNILKDPQNFHFNKIDYEKKENIYLDGYWQSFKYFDVFKDDIKKMFIYKDKFPDKLNQLLNIIKKQNSLGIHIRRGDYFNNYNAYIRHGVLKIEYYQKALEYIRNLNINIDSIYIFSDDIEWCKKEFLFDFKKIEFINTGIDLIDFVLLINCKHKIIANSSFSWWCAYLGDENGIVIAPGNWLRNEKINFKDFFLDNWIIISLPFETKEEYYSDVINYLFEKIKLLNIKEIPKLKYNKQIYLLVQDIKDCYNKIFLDKEITTFKRNEFINLLFKILTHYKYADLNVFYNILKKI